LAKEKMMSYLEQYIARFQNMPSFSIKAVSKDGMSAIPWFDIDPQAIVRELVLDEMNVAGQVQTITGEIQKWGRLLAVAKRVWEIEERRYRSWRSQFHLDAMTPPKGVKLKPGWTTTAKGEPKAPSIQTVEALYRADKEYHKHQVAIEEAEEVYNSVNAIYEAFRAKRDMLKQFAYRSQDTGEARLAV